ncbi:MAG: hypothetical protein NTY45_13615 [Elusimicrobia bacterium]|nr:hypothetical protein [Elusimicrobiota bacterium]
MAKILAEIIDSISGRNQGNPEGRPGKELEYVYIFAPSENGAGFYAVCAGK